MGVGTAGSITVTGGLFGQTCVYKGADTTTLSINSPVTDSIVNRAGDVGELVDAEPAQLGQRQATSNCGNATWTIGFILRTGATVGSGNLISLQ